MVAPLFRVVARGGWKDVSVRRRQGWGDLSRTGLIQGVETAWGSHFNQGDVGYAIASRSC